MAWRSAMARAITRAPRPRISPACIRERPPAPTSRTASRSIRSRRSRSASATRFASLELGCDDSRTVGNCDSGYSCAYTNSLAWRGPTTPMPPETNPRLVFERLFGDIDTSLTPEARARRLMHRRSILDLVRERTTELSADLGPADRRKLDEYLTSIREIERRIERAEQDLTGLNPAIDKPSGIPGALRRLRQPDVRPAAHRLPDRHDAHHHADDGARRQHADVSGDRRARPASSADPPPRQRRLDRAGHQGQRRCTWSCSPASSRR